MFHRCDGCGKTVLFGGARHETMRFCGEGCMHKNRHLLIIQALAKDIPQNIIDQHLQNFYAQKCPLCQGDGPIDQHESHWIASMLVMSRYGSTNHLCCQRCARIARLKSLCFSGVLGWWCFPWGFLITPVQISRNLWGIALSPSGKNREQLEEFLRNQLATSQYLEIQAGQPHAAEG